MFVNKTIAAMALISTLGAGAYGATLYGLTEGQSLVKFDSATPGSYSYAYAIWGQAANERIHGIDFRPATGTLYGLGSFGNIYTINKLNGMATKVAALDVQPNGLRFGTDFNPVPDRLRVTSDQGQNLRINVATGATTIDGSLAYGDMTRPNIVASAYTNSFAGATATQLFNLDSEKNSLVLQNPPNNGALTVIGGLGVNFDDRAGFDILSFGGMNKAYAALNVTGEQSSSLFTINLASGASTRIGNFIGTDRIVGLAAEPVPEPASMIALGLGAVAMIRRRRA
jgi:hypothetical protein